MQVRRKGLLMGIAALEACSGMQNAVGIDARHVPLRICIPIAPRTNEHARALTPKKN